MITAEARFIRSMLALNSFSLVACSVTRFWSQSELHINSHTRFTRGRDEACHRWSAPRGDHTTGLFRALQIAKVGIVGEEYTAVKCTTSAQRINAGRRRSSPGARLWPRTLGQ